MSKSKRELNELKEEVEAVNEKLKELTPEELEKVNGGEMGTPMLGVTVAVAVALEEKCKYGR